MPSKAQKDARKRRLNRLAQQRWRDRHPKAVKDDGQEPFDMPVYPPPVIVQQYATRPAPQKSEADALAELPMPR